ncbi:unnamed protein product [Clonostachys solani]|uniref:Uncharacterized protein n=1 Tax=Clonostachys solani TaxID=160281 RepID=A0A9P0EG52_9HYPO|nr:unnamed protein product [Clonostachys solani]
MESSSAGHAQSVANSAGKVRILLQTVTHLVPGSERHEKLDFVLNIVCQHHWQRDFDFEQERWSSYRDDFGLDKRRCFFLIDHHGYDHTIQEEQVPVIWYEWTGESLIRLNQDLPSKVLKELKKWPFTWEGRKFHRVPKGQDGEYHPKDRRKIIQSKRRLGIPISEHDLEFLREYSEHA